MKTKFFNRKTLFFLLLIFFSTSVLLFGDPDGRTGRTLKSSTSGCGGCHGSSATTDVNVTFTGPDTVNIGQTVQFTLTVAKASKTGAGLDIATRRGTLGVVSNNLHLANGELTQNANIPMSNGSVTVTFSYTAPATSGLDTLWATGLATNSNSGTSGDDWNWSANRKIVIRNPVGIEPNSIASEFTLSQNFPNPFNPGTKFNLKMDREDRVTIKVFDLCGREVYTINEGKLAAGDHTFEWNATGSNGESLNSGVYFLKVSSSSSVFIRKMVLLK